MSFKWESEKIAEWRLKARVMSLALVVLIGMYAMTGCKLSESILLVPYATYEINYKLTGELPDTKKMWSDIMDMGESLSKYGGLPLPLPSVGGGLDLASYLQNRGRVPDQCLFDEVVSGLRGTSDMTEVHRYIWSDESLWNLGVCFAQKEDPSFDPGPYVPYDRSGGGEPTIADLGAAE